ncbi:MAG: zinc-ribbon domain-containing protein, partial [Gemmatimonadales bacterium]|nr:zinc-ribbon domain-containing protein [Gemmatimonadales bacterium]
MIKCPKCGQTVLSVASVCPKCGHMLLQSPTPQGESGEFAPCRRCAKIVSRKAATCEYCGYPQRRRRQLRWGAAGIFGSAVLIAAVAGLLRWTRGSEPSWGTRPSQPPQVTVLPDSAAHAGAAIDSGAVEDTVPPSAHPIRVPPPPGRDTVVTAPTSPVVTAQPRRITTSTLNRWSLTWANLREGPGSEYAVVRVLQPGERVQVTDVAQGWWAVYRGAALEGY